MSHIHNYPGPTDWGAMKKQTLKISGTGWLCMLVGIQWVAVCKLTDEQIRAYHEVAEQWKVEP